MPLYTRVLAILVGLSLSLVTSVQAQWVSQSNNLKAGWNAVFLHVDPSYATIDELLPPPTPGHPIEEIWHWQPALPTGQFVESPAVPNTAGNQWVKWEAGSPTTSPLKRMVGNGAYLVKVASTAPTFLWNIKGKAVTPTYRWTLTGLNFIGFPTPPPANPNFESFFAPATRLQQDGEFYRYVGGDLGPANPARIIALRSTSVVRDQAYWLRADEAYSEYYGPFQIVQSGTSGIRFGDSLGQSEFRLRNVTSQPLTVTMTQLASEPAPAGQPPVVGVPMLLLRGPINTTNLTFGYTRLATGPQQWTLPPAGQPGSEVQIILGLDRSTMTGADGSAYGGILRFTDSRGLTRVDMAVSATKAASAGLWVGSASVNYVGHFLKPFAKATNEVDFASLLARLQLGQDVNGYRYEWDANTGRVLVFGGPDNRTGSYLLDGPIKVDSGDVARSFPLRLIVHNDGTASRLLQKVFHGVGLSSNEVVATKQSLLLPSRLDSARRISAVHLPTSAGNTPWLFTGQMRQGGSLTTTATVAYDDQASNPFLHTYHPDHDNLDALFETPKAQGVESHGIARQITLNFEPPADHFNSLTQSAGNLTGTYVETVTFQSRGNETKEYHALGSFVLNRVSPIATLTTQ